MQTSEVKAAENTDDDMLRGSLPIMLVMLVVIFTLFFVAGAYLSWVIGNDFMAYLFALVSFAPGTAALAVRYKIF